MDAITSKYYQGKSDASLSDLDYKNELDLYINKQWHKNHPPKRS